MSKYVRITDRRAPGTSLEAAAIADFGCTTCGVAPGRRCTSSTGKPQRSHAARWRTAQSTWTDPSMSDLALTDGTWQPVNGIQQWVPYTAS